ncbi:MAG: CvpA family protein [Candidatus Eisenbacteria bacterium]
MDVVIGALMILGLVHGVFKGAIQEISIVLALVIGVVIGGRAAAGAESVTSQLSHPAAGKVFVFVLTFLVVAIFIGLLGKMLSGLAKVANLRIIDRMIGAVVGACLMGLAIGILLTLAERLGADIAMVEESVLARQLLIAVKAIAQYLPEAAKDATTAGAFL